MKEILLILFLQLIYVPLLTLRTIFLVRNLTALASIFGVMEILVYVFGLSLVFGGDQSVAAMVVYAVGFGVGIIYGIKIEKKLAIGYILVIINTQSKNDELIDTLKNNGFGFTLFVGEGRDSKRYKLDVLTKRNRESELIATVEKFEPQAFIMSYEPTYFKGGFLLGRIKSAKN
ncbi:DUF2179 domain-containing protein [Pseudobacillus wudalianchiensis]|uniref:DUF2179 domain-containing protein n=1 Tax=Pseudobacillus wudalianchiensis TaxID=1743143 RepID=UPI0008086F00|nr:DUF2179 domain-containing protein [Bacillus wudalianchiensis]